MTMQKKEFEYDDTLMSPINKTAAHQILSPQTKLEAASPHIIANGIAEILNATDGKTLCKKLLSQLVEIVPGLARGAIFYRASKAQLEPVAHESAHWAQPRFSIDQKSLKSVLLTGAPLSHTTILRGNSAISVHCCVMKFGTNSWQGVLHIEFENAPPEVIATGTKFAEEILKIVHHRLEAFSLMTRVSTLLSKSLSTLNAVIDAKDTYTSGHSQRVATYSQAIGHELGLSPSEMDDLMLSAICHDIGKIGVPDYILKKPGLLSTDEYEEMKAHPQIGASIVEGSDRYDEIVGGIKYHHERFDGTGYPNQLAGEDIPLFGRIIAIADAFDAMTSGRSYSGYMSTDEAALDLAKKTDLFDPRLLQCFVIAHKNGSIDLRTGTTISKLP